MRQRFFPPQPPVRLPTVWEKFAESICCVAGHEDTIGYQSMVQCFFEMWSTHHRNCGGGPRKRSESMPASLGAMRDGNKAWSNDTVVKCVKCGVKLCTNFTSKEGNRPRWRWQCAWTTVEMVCSKTRRIHIEFVLLEVMIPAGWRHK